MADPRILIVDDEESMCQYLTILLEKDGYDVTAVQTGIDALGAMEDNPFDVVISDIQMPKLNGIQLLKGIKAIDPETPVIMLTSYASEQSAIEAVNLGAYSYLQKHCKNDEIKVAVRNALALRTAKCENVKLKRELTSKHSKQKIIGQSVGMRAVYKMIDKIAATTATILITGESGTGKELIARTIHDRSERADKPFVAINCGAIPETLLESQLFGHARGSFTGADRDHDGFCRQAEGGTIFLDEIGETPHAIQVKLLRMLQEREIYPVGTSKAIKTDLRVITATNRNLDLEVAEKRFRADLFYRLNVIPIELPPLRSRQDDIPLLMDHFLRMHMTDYPGTVGQCVADDALGALLRYDWPGNVRELENVIERSCIIREGSKIECVDLPVYVAVPDLEGGGRQNLLGAHITLEEVERQHILAVLDSVGGHKKRAADILEINPSTLYRKLLRYGVTTTQDEEDELSVDMLTEEDHEIVSV